MAVLNISIQTEFKTIECSVCGISFALTSRYMQERREDHRGWWCPNGHSQYFPHESDAERLTRELAAANKAKSDATMKMWEAQKAQREAEAKVRKLTARAGAGVCPCCNRTVSQMARHMKTKHPDFNKNRTM